MNFAALYRWQWLLISILVGWGLGHAHRVTPDDFSSYGNSLNSQARFEEALESRIGDIPRFKDVVVQRCVVQGLGTVDIISGLYCNGQPEEKDQAFHWKPAFFVAPVPYHSLGGSETLFAGPEQSSVREFLKSRSIPFTYAWWRSYPMATWLSASILFIGVIFPTLLTRLAYGTWIRPKEIKGISLWSAVTSGSKTSREMSSAGPSAHRDKDSGDPTPPLMEPGVVRSEAVTALHAGPLAPISVEEAAHTAFGAKADDYYPTEKRQHPSA